MHGAQLYVIPILNPKQKKSVTISSCFQTQTSIFWNIVHKQAL